MTIQQAQDIIDKWIKEYGVRYFDELTNTAILMEEVGEVARIMSRRYGEQSEKESDKGKDLGDELADVLFVVAVATRCRDIPKSERRGGVSHPDKNLFEHPQLIKLFSFFKEVLVKHEFRKSI